MKKIEITDNSTTPKSSGSMLWKLGDSYFFNDNGEQYACVTFKTIRDIKEAIETLEKAVNDHNIPEVKNVLLVFKNLATCLPDLKY